MNTRAFWSGALLVTGCALSLTRCGPQVPERATAPLSEACQRLKAEVGDTRPKMTFRENQMEEVYVHSNGETMALSLPCETGLARFVAWFDRNVAQNEAAFAHMTGSGHAIQEEKLYELPEARRQGTQVGIMVNTGVAETAIAKNTVIEPRGIEIMGVPREALTTLEDTQRTTTAAQSPPGTTATVSTCTPDESLWCLSQKITWLTEQVKRLEARCITQVEMRVFPEGKQCWDAEAFAYRPCDAQHAQ